MFSSTIPSSVSDHCPVASRRMRAMGVFPAQQNCISTQKYRGAEKNSLRENTFACGLAVGVQFTRGYFQPENEFRAEGVKLQNQLSPGTPTQLDEIGQVTEIASIISDRYRWTPSPDCCKPFNRRTAVNDRFPEMRWFESRDGNRTHMLSGLRTQSPILTRAPQ